MRQNRLGEEFSDACGRDSPRGDEVEYHRRLVNSGLQFGTADEEAVVGDADDLHGLSGDECAVGDGLGQVVNEAIRLLSTEFVDSLDDDVAAHPEHRQHRRRAL